MNEQRETEVPQQESESLVLRTEGLVKRYGKRTVANKVSYNVRQGEIVGLLGPNGAGKTTSFYMTTGLVIPNEGHVYLNEEEITEYPVYKRAQAGIGYLPQEASVFRKMSVEDNILSVLEMTKLSRQEQLDKLESLINEFRLNKVRKNKGDQLSGGERRPYCCRRHPAHCMATEIPQHRHSHHRPQRTGNADHHRPRLSFVRGKNPIPRNTRGTGRQQDCTRKILRKQLHSSQKRFPTH